MNDNDKHLHSQLVKLGDMIGDGLHEEPGGKWISREYRQICRALGLLPKQKRTNNAERINSAMQERVKEVMCQKCSGTLKQTRSGSTIGECEACSARFRLITVKRKKGGAA